MNAEKYLRMNLDELYKHLISDVMNNISEGKVLIDDLSQTERYANDSSFRASVETTKAILFGLSGNYNDLIPLCTELIEKTSSLELWQLVSTNWNLLGTAYTAIGIYERGLECYHNVIVNEKKHNLIAMTSIAYNNIAISYSNFDANDKTYEYFTKAMEALIAGGSDQPRYHSKLILYLSNMVVTLCKMDRVEEATPLVDKIHSMCYEDVDVPTKISYYIVMMQYYFCIFDFEKGKECYLTAKSMVDSNNLILLFVIAGNYIDMCVKFNLDYSFYIDDLFSLESQQNCERALPNVQVFKELRKYYKVIGNKEKYDIISDKYIEFLEQDAENNRKRQTESLRIVEDLILNTENVKELMSKYTEMEMIAAEAIRHKNLLQDAYARLELTSSLDGLTQISSRRNFDTKVQELFAQAQVANGSISIIMLDIDDFKLYNDKYGHLQGDEALKSVAEVFRDNMDSVNGLSARFGGEEFIGACNGLTVEQNRQLGEKIRKDILDMGIVHEATPLGRLSVSVGIAISQTIIPNIKSELMRIADDSLYQAKESGKNKVILTVLETDKQIL